MSARLLFATLALAATASGLAAVATAQQGSESEARLASATDPAPAQPATPPAGANATPAPSSPASRQEDEDALRIEGEKRFHANCGRCHQAPHKLSPRMMATAIRHMRVRATITDEDMRVILHYMTQ